MNKYEVKGEMTFIYNKDNGIIVETRDYQYNYEKLFANKSIYDLMSGEEFIDFVNLARITNDDGTIAHIFIDGYISNLGLNYKGLTDGNFLVDKDTFLDICKNHKVEVDWAAK